MGALVVSTEGVPAREQFELWREAGARHLLSLRWERDEPVAAPFRGVLTVRQLGTARFVDVRCEGHRVVPGGAAAARAAADVCIVGQGVGAPSRYLLGGHAHPCRPGDLLVHSPDARFEENGPADWGMRIWVIPRGRLEPLLPAAAGPSLHIPRRDGVSMLAAVAAEALAAEAGRLEPAAGDAVVDSFCRLLAVAAGVQAGAIEGGREALRAACLARARGHVDRHLADPGLGAAGVARAVGVSERQLQLLFERAGDSFGRYVTRRRLEEVRAALAGPGSRPTTELALAWGFGSLPTFYRAFHRVYGVAPGELRGADG